MNGNPNDEGAGHGIPEVPPPPGSVQGMPPSGQVAPGVPSPHYGSVPPGHVGGQPPKRRLDWGFFALGFFTPYLYGVVIGFVGNAVTLLNDQLGVAFGGILSFGSLALFIGQLVAWIVGRNNGNSRLRSWGLGGVVSVAAIMLVGLLAFGACLIGLSNTPL